MLLLIDDVLFITSLLHSELIAVLLTMCVSCVIACVG
jgi:hypothetical protein